MTSQTDPRQAYDLDLILRYTQGGCTEAEHSQVMAAVATDPAFARRVAAARAARWDAEAQLCRVLAKMPAASAVGASAGAERGRQRHGMQGGARRPLPRMLGVGIACGVLILGMAFYRTVSKSSAPSETYVTHAAQRATVTLKDGTRVLLAPQTQLSVAANFGGTTRTVHLSGEAYFDVQSATGAPFIVKTGAITTRVLGTAFTIRRYIEDDAAQIAVVSGKVSAGGRGAPVTVTAGSIARVTDSTATASTISDLRTYTDWTEGRLVFKRTPVPVLLAAVGRWYGYEFRLADSTLRAQQLSVAFKVSDPTEMMAILKGLLEVNMTFDGTHGGMPVVTLIPRRGHERQPNVPVRKDVFKPSLEIGR